MKIKQRQHGMGMLGFMTIIALAAFFLTLLFKLGPAYMNFVTIQSVMDGMVNPATPIQTSPRAIRTHLEKNLGVNNVRDIDIKKDFTIKRLENNRLAVILNHENRIHLFYNIDAMLTFTHQVELNAQ